MTGLSLVHDFRHENAAKKAPMEMLDPSRHLPDEFEGKGVAIGGCDYVVGARFRDTDQGVAHRLQNLRSGLSLHVIQLRRNYMTDPVMARAASELKAERTMQLRSGLMKGGGHVPVSPLRTASIGRSIAELHEMPAPDADLPALPFEHLRAGRFAEALVSVDAFVSNHPDNTQAIGLRGCVHAMAGNLTAAIADIDAVCSIEPNFSRYRLKQIEYTLRAGDFTASQIHLARFKRDFPGEHDADLFEIHLHLRQGRLEVAALVLRDAALPAEELENLRRALEGLRRGTWAQNPFKDHGTNRSWWSKWRGR